MKERIYRRKDNRYEGRLCIGKKADGSRAVKYVYARSREECEEKLKALRELYSSTDFGMTMDFLATQYLEYVQDYAKESSYRLYAYLWDHYLRKFFGQVTPNLVNEKMVRQFLQANAQLSDTTLKSLIILVKSILKFGRLRRGLKTQEDAIRIPRVYHDHATMSDENWSRLKLVTSTDDSLISCCIAISAYMGLRIGEVCGLRRSDVDLGNKLVNIRHTVQRMSDEDDAKTKIVIGSPKSPRSRRTIPIPEVLVEKFKILCDGRKGEEFLLTIHGKPLEPRTLQYRFQAYLRRNRIPAFNFHQLRHKFATQCVEKEVDIKALSEMLGHSSTSITMNYYVHPTMDFKRSQINKI